MAKFVETPLVDLAIKNICTGGVLLVMESMKLGSLSSYWSVGNDLTECKCWSLSEITKTFQFRHSPFSPVICKFPCHNILCFFISLWFWLVGGTRGSGTITSSELHACCLATGLFALVSGWIKQTGYCLTLTAFSSARAPLYSFLLPAVFRKIWIL